MQKYQVLGKKRCQLTTRLNWARGTEQFYLLSFRAICLVLHPKEWLPVKQKLLLWYIKAAIRSLPYVLKGKGWYWTHIPHIIYSGNANPISSTTLSSKNPFRGLLFQHIPSVSFRKDWGKCKIQLLPVWPAPDQPASRVTSGPSNQISPRKEIK